jgi:hypothetical protein
MNACELCKREVSILTFHHLIPKTLHGKKWFKKQFERKEMQTRGIMVCKPCHKHIHKTYDEKFLGKERNTLESLQQDPEISRFVDWVKNQRDKRW